MCQLGRQAKVIFFLSLPPPPPIYQYYHVSIYPTKINIEVSRGKKVEGSWHNTDTPPPPLLLCIKLEKKKHFMFYRQKKYDM